MELVGLGIVASHLLVKTALLPTNKVMKPDYRLSCNLPGMAQPRSPRWYRKHLDQNPYPRPTDHLLVPASSVK